MTHFIDVTPYDNIAPVYDSLFLEHNPYYGPVTDRELDVFNAWVPVSTKKSPALDVGCGTGLHTNWLHARGYNTIGIDVSSEMVRIAAAKVAGAATAPRFLVVDACDDGAMAEDRFRVISCFGSSLNHINDWHHFAQVVSQRLDAGGVFVFSYDNIFGIDTIARAILREYAGYSPHFWREIVLEKLQAAVRGGAFHNHWSVGVRQFSMEVGLTYERNSQWIRYLDEAGLMVKTLQGVHVIDCWSRRALRASAGVLPSGGTNVSGNRWEEWLAKVDSIVSRPLFALAANVVGVAIKK